jgi:hypothetical protein
LIAISIFVDEVYHALNAIGIMFRLSMLMKALTACILLSLQCVLTLSVLALIDGFQHTSSIHDYSFFYHLAGPETIVLTILSVVE